MKFELFSFLYSNFEPYKNHREVNKTALSTVANSTGYFSHCLVNLFSSYSLKVFLVLRLNQSAHVTVLSASGGIKVDHPKMSNGNTNVISYRLWVTGGIISLLIVRFSNGAVRSYADVVVLLAVFILVGLFSMQHYGTDKVGWLFAPIVLLWFLMIGGIGIFNIYKYDSSVLRAFSPVYIYRYFKKGGQKKWTSLGGIMLSITGWISHSCIMIDSHMFGVLEIHMLDQLLIVPYNYFRN